MTAKIFMQYLPISELAMRGFLARAVAQWQADNKMLISDIHALSASEKTHYMNEIFNEYLIKIMTKIVIKSEQ